MNWKNLLMNHPDESCDMLIKYPDGKYSVVKYHCGATYDENYILDMNIGLTLHFEEIMNQLADQPDNKASKRCVDMKYIILDNILD